MKLEIIKKYKSIEPGLVWNSVPEFVVLTGKNGSGKTHLLDILYNDSKTALTNLNGKYLDAGYCHEEMRGKVVYRKYDWLKEFDNCPTISPNELIKQVNSSGEFHSDKQPIAEKINQTAHRNGVNPDEVKAHEFDHDYFCDHLNPKTFGTLIQAYENQSNEAWKARLLTNDDYEKHHPIKKINKSFADYRDKCDFQHEALMPKYWSRSDSMTFRKCGGDDGELVQLEQLSSGEKAIVALIMFAVDSKVSEKMKLLLLDEPDAHLHPSMSEVMIVVIQEELVKKGVRVIMTTHSPSTVAHAISHGVNVTWMERGKIIDDKKPNQIVDDLSSGLIKVSDIAEGLQLLILEAKRNVLFTEGKYDKIYLETAIDVFGKRAEFDKKEIYIFACHGVHTIKNYSDNKSFPMKRKRVALFDRDKAGEDVAKDLESGVEHLFVNENEDEKIEIERLFDDELLEKHGVLKDNKINKKDESRKIFAEAMKNFDDGEEKKKIFLKFERLLERILEKFPDSNNDN